MIDPTNRFTLRSRQLLVLVTAVLLLMEQQGQGSVIAFFAELGSGATAESGG